MIRFRCPDCQVKLKAKPQQAGKRFSCPKCSATVTVPAVEETGSGSSQTISAAETGPVGEASTAAGAAARKTADDGVSEEWKSGDVILDLYEVKGVLGEGGFGKVYKVHHRGWNTELAVKSPRPGLFQSEREKKKFVQECETWVDLGMHPHTVSCYYVRTLGNIPRVFAEYVEGGSLKEWIAQDKTRDIKTVLDVAIQIGWGMAFAHEKGLVHRDLKPANVLMTPDGMAKVTDFGLARRGVAPSEAETGQPVSSGVPVSTAAGTPGYMAPEQASSVAQIDPRADIFAFGVTLWRMLGGRIPWADKSSAIARHSVTSMLKRGEPGPLPVRLTELILRSLEPEPEDRWGDFAAVVDELKAVYAEVTGAEYSRLEPKAAELLAAGLNNRAVSLLDLGKQKEAEAAFDRALATGRTVRTFEGHTRWVTSVAISPDGRWGLSGGWDKTLRLWELDWDYTFPGLADWDEAARPYLEIFLTRLCPRGPDGISRVGEPDWNDEHFKWLIKDLQLRGYGWLRAEGVRKKLEEMTAAWQGPPDLPQGE